MNKNVVQLAGAAVLLVGTAFPSSVYAQFYVGGGVGQDHAKFPSFSDSVAGAPVSVSGSESNQTAWKVYGGYQFTPNWGIEGGYTSLGTGHRISASVGAPVNQSGSTDYDLSSWYLVGTGTLPLQGGFSLLGKLGVTRNHASAGTLCLAGVCESLGSENHTDLIYGVGAQYAINKAWAVRLEWEDYGKFADIGGGKLKASAWNLSAKFSF